MGIFSFLKKDKQAGNGQQEKSAKRNNPSHVDNCDGFYPEEILVLSFATSYSYNMENKFENFWEKKYGIEDVQEILYILEDNSLVEQGSIKDAINNETLTKIQEELSRRNLSTAGTRTELVDRLISEADENELSAVFANIPYRRTKEGEALLKEFEWIPYIHFHTIEDLDIWSLTDYVLRTEDHNYREIIWWYLKKSSDYHLRKLAYKDYRECRYTMSRFVAEDGKIDLAFSLSCEVMLYDLNGLVNDFQTEDLYLYAKQYFPYQTSTAKTPDTLMITTKKYAEFLGWDDISLYTHMVEEFDRIDIPFRLFTAEECASIVILEIYGNKAKVAEIYSGAQQRLYMDMNGYGNNE